MKFNNEKLKNTSFVIDKEKKIEGRIASDIKPWLKFYDVDVEKYTDEKTAYLNTDMNVYDYFLAVTKQYGNALMIPYCSKNYHREDVITEVEKYIKRFNKMGRTPNCNLSLQRQIYFLRKCSGRCKQYFGIEKRNNGSDCSHLYFA